jgi:hypothetical protein
MAWSIKANEYESCSCKMVCRCLFGPAEPDQEWCSGALVFSIEEGASDGVNLAGAKVALVFDLPGDFLGGMDNARLLIDAKDEQRQHLESIFQGKNGGVFAAIAVGVRNWMPTLEDTISISDGEKPQVELGKAGKLSLERVRTESGDPAVLENAPIAAVLGFPRIELATAQGSKVAPPDMRAWESLGYGGCTRFEQSG